jgi:uncharacterized protein
MNRYSRAEQESLWHGRAGMLRIAGLLVVVLAFALVGYAGLTPVRAQDPTPTPPNAVNAEMQRTLSASGTGTVDAAPDEAIIVLGVFSEEDTASAAMAQTSETMQDVIDALVDAGITRDNIQTQSIRIEPMYEFPQDQPERGPGRQELVGFRAVNIAEVVMTDLTSLGEVLDAVVEAGANRIDGIRFAVDDPLDLLGEARERAWNDAEAKAQQLAELAGAQLGPVLTISEAIQGPIPFAAEMAFDRAVGSGAPIEPGQQTVRVDLQVTWTLE